MLKQLYRFSYLVIMRRLNAKMLEIECSLRHICNHNLATLIFMYFENILSILFINIKLTILDLCLKRSSVEFSMTKNQRSRPDSSSNIYLFIVIVKHKLFYCQIYRVRDLIVSSILLSNFLCKRFDCLLKFVV